jgi:glycosyltransferase involved in cell wall biosynthesis
LKVLHLVAPAPFGGLERVVYALASGQKKKGYDVQVIALLESGVTEPSLVSDLHEAGVPVVQVTQPARAFRTQRRIVLDICKRIRPDVLHSHGYLPDVISASLGFSYPAVRVSTVHGFTRGDWRNRLYERLQRWSYARFHAVVAVSGKLATALGSSRKARARTHKLQNAWMVTGAPLTPESARDTLHLSPDVFSIGWVGRISHEKGLDVLLEALSTLKDLAFHLTVIGDGIERSRLQQRAKDLGIADRVSWPGVLLDAPRLMRAFDVFVISSRTEGTPITLFEAMHSGVPIVATSVGGVPDVVSPGEAILVHSENPAELAAGIRDVYERRAEASVRAARAKIRLETNFASVPWIEAYENIYKAAQARR